MDEDDETDLEALPPPEPKKRGGTLGAILAIVAVTLLGAGAGGAVGLWQFNKLNEVAKQRANQEPDKRDNALAWDENTAIARLEPVVANLAKPANTWIRLDTAMVFDRGQVDDVERMKAELAESVLQFLRTVTISELQGASAFNHLRDDLNERAQLASAGVVRELIIETMVLQ